jgi:hypothetical protein
MTRVAVLVTALLWVSTAGAQQSVIDHCRKTSSDADRIACLEAAILGREYQAPSPVEPDEEAVPDNPVPDEPVVPVEPTGIGADQVIVRNQTQVERRASLEVVRGLQVASYDKVPYEKLLVRLENGQVWRQIRGDTQVIRVNLKRNQTVDIEESSLGGYKLRLNEMRRTVRVERVK